MFERFTDRARRVVLHARRESHRLGDDHIGTEHLLLALAREGSGVAATLLHEAGADHARVRHKVLALLGFGTPMTWRALQRAQQRAAERSSAVVEMRDLVEGIRLVGDPLVAGALVAASAQAAPTDAGPDPGGDPAADPRARAVGLAPVVGEGCARAIELAGARFTGADLRLVHPGHLLLGCLRAVDAAGKADVGAALHVDIRRLAEHLERDLAL